MAAFAFFLGLILQLDRLVNRPERTWYEGRAVAKSGKTLGWRYAVGGEPFRVDTLSQKQADDLFARRSSLVPHLVDNGKHVRREFLDTVELAGRRERHM